MVIQTSCVNMASEYRKTTYTADSVSYTGWGGSEGSADFTNLVPTAMDSAQSGEVQEKTEVQKEALYVLQGNTFSAQQSSDTEESKVTSWVKETLSSEKTVEFRSLENLLQTISEKIQTIRISADELFRRLMEAYKARAEAMLSGMGQSYLTGIGASSGIETGTGTVIANSTGQVQEEWIQELTVSNLYSETEKLGFCSEGTVTTADGKNMTFDLSFTMSQSFTSYTNVQLDYKKIMMIDPLVISLNDEPVSVSDEKFTFDLDADGEEDNISLLGKMCAFLALDKNEDGIINDGSELFGTQSGDGFGELAVFDLDKNGWIDENDEVFNHLKIWRKDSEGNDSLVALGIAGIGAVYLGNVSSEYKMRTAEDNSVNAVFKKSGVYLKENGTAGVIQHVDFAKEQTV